MFLCFLEVLAFLTKEPVIIDYIRLENKLYCMGEIMRKVLIVLIMFFCVFLAIGCTGNKTGTPNETGTPEKAVTAAEVKNETLKETPAAGITSATVAQAGGTVSGKQNANETQNTTAIQSAVNTPTLREFTLEELAQYNGKNGTSYVAYQGKVYDVSSSYLWKNGVHKGHSAGKDLTDELNKSPHGPKVIYGYPVVGTLKQ